MTCSVILAAVSATEGADGLSETIVAHWINFAAHGDPNGPGLPIWPAFNETQPQAMYFAHTAHPGPVASEEGLKALEAYFAWQRSGGTGK